jgi:Kef-type K+ transport system membrane component KefB
MAKGFIDHLSHAFETPLTNSVLIFAIILFIILLSPILLRKIRIPGIIGLIVSGVIIGPHGLNILAQSSAVDLFSTIGLLYIMFIAGLELDMNEFEKTKHKSITFGLFTFAVPLLVGYPICHYILGYSVNSSILIASMFSTHTLVAYPIVNSYGIAKNEAVAITTGGTILTDTAVLIILAIIVGASQGSLDQDFWIGLVISFAIFLFIMLGIIPRVAKWFFQKVETEKTADYIFVLFVVFFAAFIAEIAGLEPIIGAFVAGLALNRLIPHSSALMNRIEFIGNSIFIPFFLISVGMIVNVNVLLEHPSAWLIAGTLTIVAIFGKWLASWFTQKVFKYTVAQRQVIFGLSSAHAAATLAVIMVGYEAGIIDEDVLNGVILLILVTCIVATIVTERASKKILLEGGQEITNTDDKAYDDEQIVLPIANLNNMEILLDIATLIRNKKSRNPLTVLSVVPNNEMAEINLKTARKNLDSIAKYASGSETEVNIMATIDFNIASGISRASREVLANCILLGWPSKTNIIDKLVGERTESILNRTDINIFMCHLEKPFISQKRIILFSPPISESEKGFTYWMTKVSKLTQELSLPLVIVCNTRTEKAINEFISSNKISLNIEFINHYNWDDLTNLRGYVKDEDLLIFVSARAGEVSYNPSFDGISTKLDRVYSNNNRILIYPSRRKNYLIDDFVDVTHGHTSGTETILRLGKRFGGMWKK